MKFMVLNYGVDLDCWHDGTEIGNMIEKLSSDKPTKKDKILSTHLNNRWYDNYKKNSSDWPHPNKLLIAITKLNPNINIDWIPELNYLGIWTDDENLIDMLRTKFTHMLNAEAIK